MLPDGIKPTIPAYEQAADTLWDHEDTAIAL